MQVESKWVLGGWAECVVDPMGLLILAGPAQVLAWAVATFEANSVEFDISVNIYSPSHLIQSDAAFSRMASFGQATSVSELPTTANDRHILTGGEDGIVGTSPR